MFKEDYTFGEKAKEGNNQLSKIESERERKQKHLISIKIIWRLQKEKKTRKNEPSKKAILIGMMNTCGPQRRCCWKGWEE